MHPDHICNLKHLSTHIHEYRFLKEDKYPSQRRTAKKNLKIHKHCRNKSSSALRRNKANSEEPQNTGLHWLWKKETAITQIRIRIWDLLASLYRSDKQVLFQV